MDNIKIVEVWWNEMLVGKIAQTQEGVCVFEYDNFFLNEGFSISPFELPLRKGVFTANATPFEGGFGVFDDCLPDGWGLLVLDRYLRKNNINPNSLTLLDRLSLVGTNGRGALEFKPDRSVMTEDECMDFDKLAESARMIIESEDYNGENIDILYKKGGSPGGARPKVFVKHENKEWFVKFPAKYDNKNIGKIEYEYSLLAKKCGVEMPETKLFEGKFFGTERFDRSKNGKIHVTSVAGLIRADYRIPCIDYLHIFQICAQLTNDLREMWKIYRLMVFNYLIENKDDHAKNFAFMFRNGEWRLTPAYDLLPSVGFNGYHTTSINDSVNPTDRDILDVAAKAGLHVPKAKNILNEIKEIITSFNLRKLSKNENLSPN